MDGRRREWKGGSGGAEEGVKGRKRKGGSGSRRAEVGRGGSGSERSDVEERGEGERRGGRVEGKKKTKKLRSLHTHSGGTPDPIVYIQYTPALSYSTLYTVVTLAL